MLKLHLSYLLSCKWFENETIITLCDTTVVFIFLTLYHIFPGVKSLICVNFS